MEFESKLKHLLLILGFRYRNEVADVVRLGNGVDTTRRTAWFSYAITWKRTPKQALLDEMASVGPFAPTTQAYASDVDRIEIRLKCTEPQMGPETA